VYEYMPAQPLRRHCPPAGTPLLPEMTSYLPMTSYTERADMLAQFPVLHCCLKYMTSYSSMSAEWEVGPAARQPSHSSTPSLPPLVRPCYLKNSIWRHIHQWRHKLRHSSYRTFLSAFWYRTVVWRKEDMVNNCGLTQYITFSLL
jgi:hypothetical protein